MSNINTLNTDAQPSTGLEIPKSTGNGIFGKFRDAANASIAKEAGVLPPGSKNVETTPENDFFASGNVQVIPPAAPPAPSQPGVKPAAPTVVDHGAGFLFDVKPYTQPAGPAKAPVRRSTVPVQPTRRPVSSSEIAASFSSTARRVSSSATDREHFFMKKRWTEELQGPNDLRVEQVKFRVDAVLAYQAANDWGLLRCVRTDTGDVVTVRGEMLAAPKRGDTITAIGTWSTDHHGAVFSAKGVSVDSDNAAAAAYRFLAERVGGIGAATAQKLLTRYGDALPGMLSKPEQLHMDTNIGKQRAETIATAWARADAFEKVYTFLRAYGIGPKTSQKIALSWGKDALTRLLESPWDLYKDIGGIGFVRADSIAINCGKLPTDPLRIDAALSFALDDSTQGGGHCWVSREDLVERAALAIEPACKEPDRSDDEQRAFQKLKALVAQRFESWRNLKKPTGGQYSVCAEIDGIVRVYPVPLWNAEKVVVSRLIALLRTASKEGLASPAEIDRAMKAYQKQLDPNRPVDESQIEALRIACTNGISALTGKPGCGKTTITKVFLDIAEKSGKRILCCSPTGKAAVRFYEATGRRATTIHTLLASHGRYAESAESKTLPCDILVIDESSMIDIKIMRELLEAVENGTRILFVGDPDQLQPVDPGQPFEDMITSKVVPTARLQKIHRVVLPDGKEKQSGIINALHQILDGRVPVETQNADDFKIEKIPEPLDSTERAAAVSRAAENLVTFVSRVLPTMQKRNGKLFDPREDVIVLSPMKKGTLGVVNLNKLLKAVLNPSRPGYNHFQFKNWRLDIGDRVIHTKNNKKLGVANGDMGTVVAIDEFGDELKAVVAYQGPDGIRRVSYDRSLAGKELQHAFALSIHKIQGSEAPCAVVVCAKEHFTLLEPRLIFTGLSRGKEHVRLFAQPAALRRAVEIVGKRSRNTGIVRALREEMAGRPSMTAIPLAQMAPAVEKSADDVNDDPEIDVQASSLTGKEHQDVVSRMFGL